MAKTGREVYGSGIEECCLARDLNYEIHEAVRSRQPALRAAFHKALSLPKGEKRKTRYRQLIERAKGYKSSRWRRENDTLSECP